MSMIKCVTFKQYKEFPRYGEIKIHTAEEQFNEYDWSYKTIVDTKCLYVDKTDSVIIVVFYKKDEPKYHD